MTHRVNGIAFGDAGDTSLNRTEITAGRWKPYWITKFHAVLVPLTSGCEREATLMQKFTPLPASGPAGCALRRAIGVKRAGYLASLIPSVVPPPLSAIASLRRPSISTLFSATPVSTSLPLRRMSQNGSLSKLLSRLPAASENSRTSVARAVSLLAPRRCSLCVAADPQLSAS